MSDYQSPLPRPISQWLVRETINKTLHVKNNSNKFTFGSPQNEKPAKYDKAEQEAHLDIRQPRYSHLRNHEVDNNSNDIF